MTQDTMVSRSGVWDKLPAEIIERVLSFLPVPVLCRMRTVCKAWNKLIGTPSFHDQCDLNGKNNVYLFMWKEFWGGSQDVMECKILETAFKFFDLDARRWYSIQTKVCDSDDKIDNRFMAMNDSLVCKFATSRGKDNDYVLTIFDPVAKTMRTLPTPPECYARDEFPCGILTIVNDATRSYKVFLFNNLDQTVIWRTQPRVYVYESFTNKWRELKILPKVAEKLDAFSSVVLHQTVFVAMQEMLHDYGRKKVSIFSHELQEETWVKVWQMGFRSTVQGPQLVVSGNRLFLTVWVDPIDQKDLPSDDDSSDFKSLFHTNQDYPYERFEMYEILLAENGRKPVIQLTRGQLLQIFGTDVGVSVTYGFPCFDSDGICNSVVLVNRYTGRLRMYELATGSVDVLPPHPLMQTSEVQPIPWVYNSFNLPQLEALYFECHAKNMKLSLRNLLAQR